MEDSRASHLIFDVNSMVFCFESDMDVAKVNIFLHEHTSALSYSTLTAQFFILTINNLHHEDFIVDSGTGRVENHLDFHVLTWRNDVSQRSWHKHGRRM